MRRHPGPGPGAQPGGESWSRAERVGFASIASLALLCLPLLVAPWYAPSGDASLYIATSRSLLAGEGYRYLGEPFVVRPPGFAWLIAPTLALADPPYRALNGLVGGFGLAAALGLAALARAQLGLPLALLTGLAVWLNPGFQRLCNEVLSDVPGLALVVGCLHLERFAARRPGWRREVALGLGIGLSAYVRTAILLLVPAIAAARLGRRGRANGGGAELSPAPGWRAFLGLRVGLFALVALAVVLPWIARNAALSPDRVVDQTRLHSYGTAMWQRDPSDPDSAFVGVAGLLERVPLRAAQIADVLGSRLQSRIRGERAPDPRAVAVRLPFALGLLACSAVVLVRRRAPGQCFVWAQLAVLVVYFGFGDRLLLPVYALALPAAVEVARDAATALVGRRRAVVLVSGALLMLIAIDFHPRQDWPEHERRHRALESLAEELATRVGPDARLASALGFSYGVYLERPVYSLYPAIARAADPRAAAEAVLDRYAIDHVVLWDEIPRERELVPYFRERYGEGESVGPARLWRVR